MGWFGSLAESLPVIENFQFGEEFTQFAEPEQVVEIARAGSECALANCEGFVDQQAAGCDYACDRRNQRSMEESEYQNRCTTVTSERNLSWVLKVCAERFDRELSLRSDFAKFREERSIAVDPNDWNAGCSRGECMAPATAREVGDHAQLGRGLNSRQLVAEEFRRRRSLRHGLKGQRVDR